MKKFDFPSVQPIREVPKNHWLNWQWQLRNSFHDLSTLQKWIDLLPEEQEFLNRKNSGFAFRVTPYYLSLIKKNDPMDPIRRIALARIEETIPGTQELIDPLNEKNNRPAPRIIHRYSDRVLFLITDFCSVYCRYCTRKYFTGQEQVFPKKEEYESALKYISENKGICEVILSGGDPLTLSDHQLEKVLSDLRNISHIEIIRIGTRMPIVCPMRIDINLVNILRKYKPIFLMTHFNHPQELTWESTQALELFVDHGIPVFNQIVLLNGINNHPAIIQALCRRLVYLRVKPYYLFQCDPSKGSEHFRTPIEEGEHILQELWGHLSGLAMPIFSLDIPNGGGKVTITPNFEIQRTTQFRSYKGWDGVESCYINPKLEQTILPSNLDLYQQEWEIIKKSKTNKNFA